MKNYVLYHANCTDGMGAAFAAYQNFGDSAEYIPVQYNQPLPEIELNSTVHIVDFSYPRAVMQELLDTMDFVVVIDHHKTAQAELEGLNEENFNCDIMFNMNHSGAFLAWEYYVGKDKKPDAIHLIEDRDLFKHRYIDTEPFAKGIGLHVQNDFRRLGEIILDPKLFDNVLRNGRAIMKFMALEIDKLLEHPPAVVPFLGHVNVPVFNVSPFLASDLLNTLLTRDTEKQYPFAVSYFDMHTMIVNNDHGVPSTESKRIYQLRSTNDREDVGELAYTFGKTGMYLSGGGHRNAAGLTKRIDTI